jgi:hypothetical protein
VSTLDRIQDRINSKENPPSKDIENTRNGDYATPKNNGMATVKEEIKIDQLQSSNHAKSEEKVNKQPESVVKEEIPESDILLRVKPEPRLSGLKRTASMMSKFFGADMAKQKFNSKLQK